MRASVRSAVALAAAIAVLLNAAPATAVPAGRPTATAAGIGPDGRPATPVDWRPCPERPDDAGVRCATLDLPVDWADPGGPTFPLALARRTATDPAARIGSLLVHPGGPGISGVKHVLAADLVDPDLQRRFDVVGFDPRGVGRSNPVVCSADLLARQPFPVPADQAGYDGLVAYHRELGEDCRAHTGPLFDHVDTLSVVRDADAIRAALGERQISFYGVSYGTLAGQQYAERFPGRVRAMVVDSNMDHSLGTGAFLVTEAAAVEDSFREFTAWCERGTACPLHGRDVGALYDRLMGEADAGGLADPATGAPLTWFDLSDQTLDRLYGPDWPALAGWLDAIDRAAPGAGASPAPHAGNDVAPYPLAAFCADWSLPVRGFTQWTQYLQASRAAAPHLRGSTPALAGTASCLGWPGTAADPQQRLDVHTATPILEINAVHDPATPYAWALDVAAQLGGSGRLVTYLGWGHGAYRHTPCTIGYIDRYLIDETLPPPGATCAAPPDAAAGALG